MPDLLKDFDTSDAARIKLASGIVSRVVGDDVYAIVPSFNQQHEFGPTKLSGPAVGDKVLVAFDEQGTAWIVAWQGVPIPPSILTVSEIDFIGVGGVPGQARLMHAGFSEGLMFKTNDWPYFVLVGDVDGGAGFGLYPRGGGDQTEGWEVYVEAGTQDAIHFWSNTVGMDAIRLSMPGGSAKISFGAWIGGPTHDTEVHRRAPGILAIGANDIIVANDARLTDARFPTAHQYTHTPGGADVVTAMGVLDSRATEEAPYASATYRQSFRAELKQRASITGTPGTGTYGILVTHSPWTDDSGGGVKQTWYDDSNPPREFTRRGTIAGGWSAWYEVAKLDSPTFIGTPTAPTPSVGDNSTKIATTAFVQAAHPKVTRSSTAPVSPNDGDIWIYNGISGVFWEFVYDSSETTYKWKFVGGAPFAVSDTGDVGTSGNTWIGFSGIVATPRAGDYIVQFGDTVGISVGGSGGNLNIIWDGQLGDGIGLYDEPMYTRFMSHASGINQTWFTRSRGPIRLNLAASKTLQIYYSVSNWDLVSTNRHISFYPARW